GCLCVKFSSPYLLPLWSPLLWWGLLWQLPFTSSRRCWGHAYVSSRIAQLEEFIGAPLFIRDTRNVSLTLGGRRYLTQCEQWVSHATDLVEDMRGMLSSLSGSLRIHALPGFAIAYLGDIAGKFQERYPEVKLDLVVDDGLVDPVKDGFDCTLQIFEPVSDALVARRLFAWRGVFCASPRYLSSQGAPSSPIELGSHRLGLYSRYPTEDRWTWYDGENRMDVELVPSLRSNSVKLLTDYASGGYGIVYVPTLIAHEFLLSGELQPLLTKFQLPRYWLYAVYPAPYRTKKILQIFLDMLEGRPGEDAPWDEELIKRGILAPQPLEGTSPL
ncbi:LysR family transcriptional regulator, partial [Burkholderia gladioli]|uniref:LysR family transcriptional regulator n=1 Tax=Burkholderia gladioli TaxID=28095 RepID=UPI001ABB14C7